MGFGPEDINNKPCIGIINTWSDMNTCHSHFRNRAEEIKRGVYQSGGFPIELPAMSLGEILVKPSTMLYRNFLAMEAEELMRCHPIDGVVLMGGCDKTTPALLMAALSMNIPAIVQAIQGIGPNLSGPTNLANGMGGFSNIEDQLSLGDKGRGGGNLGVEVDKLSKALVVLSSVDPDLLTVLGQISESSKTTADILTAEQGSNSFNVYDKTGDKNAGESSKKLSAISTSSKLTATEQRAATDGMVAAGGGMQQAIMAVGGAGGMRTPEKPLSKKSTGELTDADIKQIIANQETNRLIAEAKNGRSRGELSRDMQASRPSDGFSPNGQAALNRLNQQRQNAADSFPN